MMSVWIFYTLLSLFLLFSILAWTKETYLILGFGFALGETQETFPERIMFS